MQTLIDARQIQERVAALGQQIADDYRGRPLTILGVLTGSIILVADLIRQIDMPHRVGLIQASSYRGRVTRPGELTVSTDLVPEIAGRDVLLVDDIFDTGRTLDELLKAVRSRGPASVRSCVLLWKEGRCEVSIAPDYHGFPIPDVFVVGYGLDYNDDYRHLPHIAVLEDEARLPGVEARPTLKANGPTTDSGSAFQ